MEESSVIISFFKPLDSCSSYPQSARWKMESLRRLVVEIAAKIGKIFFGCKGEVVRLEGVLATVAEGEGWQC